EGTYTVTLTSSDKLNVSNTISIDVLIEEPEVPFQPVILNPGFDEEGADSYRDNWRNGDLGGVLQITSSPVHDGVRAGKFPSGGDRVAYQLVTVEEDQDYVISFYYTMKTSPVGSLSIAILGGDVTDPARIEAATIASETFNDQNNADEYVQASISFNSGPNTEVAIYLSNVDVECRFDTFTIAPE
ncbi:MAG: PKD domain-containing protein, partial [Bacteroidota bacterium]